LYASSGKVGAESAMVLVVEVALEYAAPGRLGFSYSYASNTYKYEERSAPRSKESSPTRKSGYEGEVE
jgi:hypothetical protein